MRSPRIRLAISLRCRPWRFNREQCEVRHASWVLFEELRPVHSHLDKVSDLRLTGEAADGWRQCSFDMLGGRFRDFGYHVGERDICADAVLLLARCVQGYLDNLLATISLIMLYAVVYSIYQP
jgi:hypothetical protein